MHPQLKMKVQQQQQQKSNAQTQQNGKCNITLHKLPVQTYVHLRSILMSTKFPFIFNSISFLFFCSCRFIFVPFCFLFQSEYGILLQMSVAIVVCEKLYVLILLYCIVPILHC